MDCVFCDRGMFAHGGPCISEALAKEINFTPADPGPVQYRVTFQTSQKPPVSLPPHSGSSLEVIS